MRLGERQYQIGQQIQRARQKRHLSQSEFGALLTPPVSHAAVSDIERGRTHLDAGKLETIASLLDVSLLFLLGLDYSRRSVWGPPYVTTEDTVMLDATGMSRCD